MKFYQEKVSEGLIQCELYRQCLNNGIFAYPEYKCRINGKRCRFDLAILNGDNVVMIIECKSTNRYGKTLIDTKQFHKYRLSGLPIVYCTNLDMINPIVRKIKRFLSSKQRK